MKAISTIKKELCRLKRRRDHLSERILKKKRKGDNYSYEYAEAEQASGRIDALKWVLGGE